MGFAIPVRIKCLRVCCVADVVKIDEPFDPVAVGLLGPAAVMAGAKRFAKLV